MSTNHALIGIGGFGGQHLRTIKVLELSEELHLTAVCDPAIHRWPEVIDELLAQDVRIYADYRDLLEQETNLATITIAAPIPLHHQMAMACLERDLFIYLEKPAVPRLAQLDELIARDTRQRVAVGFNMIESDWSRQIRRWIESGALGELREVRVGACWPRADSYYNRAGWAGRMTLGAEPVVDGPATNALAHLIHAIMFFAAERDEGFAEPSEVQAEMYRARPIESYDTVCLRGRFPSGCAFLAALSHASQIAFPFEIHLSGTKGWAKVTQDGQILESSLGPTHIMADIEQEVLRTYRSFLTYVRGERARPSTLLRDTRGYALAIEAMLSSAGGIHEIGPAWIDRRANEGDFLYSVPDMVGAIAESLSSGRLFSEQDLPWTVETSVVSVKETKVGRKIAAQNLADPASWPVTAL